MDQVPLFWHYLVHKIHEISTLSNIEYVRIVAQYNSIGSKKVESEKSLKGRGYNAEAIAQATNRARETFTPVESMNLKFTRPFHELKSDLFNYGMLLLENYERGQLPFPGSVSEQPAQVIEILGLLQSLRFENDLKQRKKLEADVGNKRKGNSRTRR